MLVDLRYEATCYEPACRERGTHAGRRCDRSGRCLASLVGEGHTWGLRRGADATLTLSRCSPAHSRAWYSLSDLTAANIAQETPRPCSKEEEGDCVAAARAIERGRCEVAAVAYPAGHVWKEGGRRGQPEA